MMIQWEKKSSGGGISASAPRPHGKSKSEGSNTGKLIPVTRQPKNLKSSCRMMIGKLMIQLGEELAMLRMQEAKAKNQLGKQRMRKAKKPAELAMQRMRKRGTVNAEDAK